MIGLEEAGGGILPFFCKVSTFERVGLGDIRLRRLGY